MAFIPLSHNIFSTLRCGILAGASVALLAACSSEPEQPKGPTPEEIAKEAQAAFVKSVPGIYEGMLPCADCSGIRTELYVRAKGSYTRVSHYEGKDGSWEEAGVWRVEFAPDAQTIEGATIVFEPVLSDDGVWKAVPQGPAMRLLDRSGKRIEGALADHYVLHKN